MPYTDTANVRLKMTCWGCPVQIEGEAYGIRVYFRERNGHWTFSTWDGNQTEPTLVAQGTCEELMDLQEAMKLAETLCHTMRK